MYALEPGTGYGLLVDTRLITPLSNLLRLQNFSNFSASFLELAILPLKVPCTSKFSN